MRLTTCTELWWWQPPPPPIGADVLGAQRAELEDLRAQSEVHKRQIGALVFEKGKLNGALQKREEELRSLGEEKAAVVAALGAALKRVTEEREDAQRQVRRAEPPVNGSGRAAAGGEAQLSAMVASQKRTIEALRHELSLLRHGAAPAGEAGVGGEAAGGGSTSGGGGGGGSITSSSSSVRKRRKPCCHPKCAWSWTSEHQDHL